MQNFLHKSELAPPGIHIIAIKNLKPTYTPVKYSCHGVISHLPLIPVAILKAFLIYALMGIMRKQQAP